MEKIKHAERAHALLSASGSSRWLNCTPSARLEEKYDRSKSSVYADEGTLAHEIAELKIRHRLNLMPEKVYHAEISKLRKNKLYLLEMDKEVDKYEAYVLEAYGIARKKTVDAELLIEERFDFTHLVEQGFGTGDITIIANGVLEIIDLKYGKGVKVNPERNTQLMLYASGALRAFELLYDIHTIKLTIVQPRMDNISSWEMPVKELEEWGEMQVKPKALQAYKGEGEYQAGDWCKWCKVKATCSTLAKKNLELAKYEFADPEVLTEEQLLDIRKQLPMLADWAKAIEEYILETALAGKQWQGLKLVEGRKTRSWIGENEVLAFLKQKGYKLKEITDTKIKGIPAIETLLGKDFAELKGFINTPSGKPTLVPDTDKRPSIGVEQARLDFADTIDTVETIRML